MQEAIELGALSPGDAECLRASLDAFSPTVHSENGEWRLVIPVSGERNALLVALIDATERCLADHALPSARLRVAGHTYLIHPAAA